MYANGSFPVPLIPCQSELDLYGTLDFSARRMIPGARDCVLFPRSVGRYRFGCDLGLIMPAGRESRLPFWVWWGFSGLCNCVVWCGLVC